MGVEAYLSLIGRERARPVQALKGGLVLPMAGAFQETAHARHKPGCLMLREDGGEVPQ